jgi:hypothetical protein
MRARTIHPVLSFLAILCLAGCGKDGAQPGSLAPSTQSAQAVSDPNATRTITLPFDSGNFTAGGENTYFPLVPGMLSVYRQDTPAGVETDTVEVTADTKGILGVTTTVVHDRLYLNGALAEDTFDWYAADHDGNVWYFGEDTKEFQEGGVVSTTGSWEAGKEGAQSGIIMLANPMVGDTYQQENSPGVVADMARVKGLDETVTVPYGTLTGCIKTQEWTPIEPGSRAFKFYAPGIGTVLEDENKNGGPVELISFSKP